MPRSLSRLAELHMAQRMLDEFNDGRLEVVKVRKEDGTWIRVPISVNAEWYSKFCRRFEQPRRRYPKPRTLIKRCHTRRALEKIANGATDGVYVGRLLDFIRNGNQP